MAAFSGHATDSAQKSLRRINRRRFNGIPELTALVYATLVEYLVADGTVQHGNFVLSTSNEFQANDREQKVESFQSISGRTNLPCTVRTGS